MKAFAAADAADSGGLESSRLPLKAIPANHLGDVRSEAHFVRSCGSNMLLGRRSGGGRNRSENPVFNE